MALDAVGRQFNPNHAVCCVYTLVALFKACGVAWDAVPEQSLL